MQQVFDIAILGASGYTGAELVRLIATHPFLRIAALSADRKAGMSMGEVFPHLRHLDLPPLQPIGAVDFAAIDLVFCALPHATSQEVIAGLPRSLRIVDLSADFRLRDPEVYARWYGHEHRALDLQAEAVYGLTEFYRDEIRSARLVAGTGCNAATGIYGILPLLSAGVIDPDEIIIDLATGVSGAGRGAKEGMLHSEVSEGYHAYNVAKHRHLAEFDQEFSRAAGRPVAVTFTPHLLPQNRGILATIYLRGEAEAIHAALASAYEAEPFVVVLPLGEAPATRHVRGSNFVHLGVIADRRPGRAMVFSTLDNLAKGSSGQALQNANLMLGLPETAGLMAAPLFP
ncbi:MAG TPA: N-acetyl-gamma-glutamyl-phosphate reductase [Amaricoccus sp.]|uniref:N-acetyl-gamma-glutamyl-phosphate reductase n=1 Tax=Amaricoccus sp. TaxID=1872485 RepID=UPI002C5ACAEA|nr:N-acetyl-gamma-glutamyl-phosphate reductase [Amaricoccus sp.]HMQ92603.1 N-acetyl-gamma-glutamyl-phosphate reductase [Amaricoccus sp.]HMR52520.1 N-acetyl-gamma-glutamyl-phosphate reductase [Amaricoccus sp.]HMR59857.1 N-acetyl-gamma-glutamyl-phosphate reductase [Amaricoccus sp.]HMT99441.1 N-acetyl-gamma-glutamyl-phosphate reductase [Amaricoccus sp.]